MKLILFLCLISIVYCQNKEVRFTAYTQEGLKICLQSNSTIKSFTFNGNVNRNISYDEIGQIHGRVHKPRNGEMCFEDQRKVYPDDQIDYWYSFVETTNGVKISYFMRKILTENDFTENNYDSNRRKLHKDHQHRRQPESSEQNKSTISEIILNGLLGIKTMFNGESSQDINPCYSYTTTETNKNIDTNMYNRNTTLGSDKDPNGSNTSKCTCNLTGANELVDQLTQSVNQQHDLMRRLELDKNRLDEQLKTSKQMYDIIYDLLENGIKDKTITLRLKGSTFHNTNFKMIVRDVLTSKFDIMENEFNIINGTRNGSDIYFDLKDYRQKINILVKSQLKLNAKFQIEDPDFDI